jgi:hypothetical protein
MVWHRGRFATENGTDIAAALRQAHSSSRSKARSSSLRAIAVRPPVVTSAAIRDHGPERQPRALCYRFCATRRVRWRRANASAKTAMTASIATQTQCCARSMRCQPSPAT